MFNLFSLFSSNFPRKKRNATVPPDLAIMLVRNYSRSLKDFNDEEELQNRVERFADELDDISNIQEQMTYDSAVALLRKFEKNINNF